MNILRLEQESSVYLYDDYSSLENFCALSIKYNKLLFMQIYIFMDTIKKIELKWRCVLSIENHNENSILDTLYNFLHFVHLCICKNAKLVDKL